MIRLEDICPNLLKDIKASGHPFSLLIEDSSATDP